MANSEGQHDVLNAAKGLLATNACGKRTDVEPCIPQRVRTGDNVSEFCMLGVQLPRRRLWDNAQSTSTSRAFLVQVVVPLRLPECWLAGSRAVISHTSACDQLQGWLITDQPFFMTNSQFTRGHVLTEFDPVLFFGGNTYSFSAGNGGGFFAVRLMTPVSGSPQFMRGPVFQQLKVA